MDLTQGNIRRQLVKMAIPLLIGSLLQQLYNTIDAAVIGRYVGKTAFAAIGISGAVMNLFVFIIVGACTGVSIYLGQNYGSQNMKRFRNAYFLSVLWGLILTILLSVVSLGLLNKIVGLVNTPKELVDSTTEYLRIIFWGLLATYLYNYLTSVLRAVGNTLVGLVVLAGSIIVNLILDMLFIAYLGLGVAGAAYATVISQVISVVFCYIYIRNNYSDLAFHKEDMYWDQSVVHQISMFAFVSALHQSSIYIGRILIQGAVNNVGVDVIAAYTAATRIEGFINAFGSSGASAISILVAQNLGARNEKRLKESVKISLELMIILGIVLSLGIAIFSKYSVIAVMGTRDQRLIEYGVIYLRIISIFYVLNYIGNVFVGYFRGIGKIDLTLYGTMLHISFRVLMTYRFIDVFGISTVAWATGAGWIIVTSFHIIAYQMTKRSMSFSITSET